MDRFEDLMTGYCEGLLSAVEEDELAALVRNDPAVRHRFAALAEVEGLLQSHFTTEQAHEAFLRRAMACLPDTAKQEQTVARVMSRIAEAPAAPAPPGRTQDAPGAPPSPPSRADRPRERVFDWRVLAAAAIVVFLVGLAVYQALIRDPAEARRQALVGLTGMPFIESQTGAVSVLTEYVDGRADSTPVQALTTKMGVQTEGPSRAVIKYPDGTRLTVVSTKGTSRLWLHRLSDYERVISRESSFGKRVTLEAGCLEADVARQPADEPLIVATPQAEALVLGTRFRLTVTADATRLEVHEGRVHFARRSDGRSVLVSANQFAVTGPGVDLAAQPGGAPPAPQPPEAKRPGASEPRP
ncbi:MAG: FecR family protein [Planctomycetota bacterium]|nr:FecR family protein [Planctomycetota bacterium]